MNAGSNDLSLEQLIERLSHSDQMVRMHAATVLGTMAEKAAPAVPALIAMLDKGTVQDRRLAALTLGEIGPAAEAAVPALLAAAQAKDESLSDLAIRALEEIDLPADLDEAA